MDTEILNTLSRIGCGKTTILQALKQQTIRKVWKVMRKVRKLAI